MIAECEILNHVLRHDMARIEKYLKGKNLFHDIEEFEFKAGNVLKKVSFEKMDYLMFISGGKSISEPVFYFQYEKNPGGTHYQLMNKQAAFKYIYLDQISRKLNTEQIIISSEDDLLVVVYMQQEAIKNVKD